LYRCNVGFRRGENDTVTLRLSDVAVTLRRSEDDGVTSSEEGRKRKV
jgi:hypothetical protein